VHSSDRQRQLGTILVLALAALAAATPVASAGGSSAATDAPWLRGVVYDDPDGLLQVAVRFTGDRFRLRFPRLQYNLRPRFRELCETNAYGPPWYFRTSSSRFHGLAGSLRGARFHFDGRSGRGRRVERVVISGRRASRTSATLHLRFFHRLYQGICSRDFHVRLRPGRFPPPPRRPTPLSTDPYFARADVGDVHTELSMGANSGLWTVSLRISHDCAQDPVSGTDINELLVEVRGHERILLKDASLPPAPMSHPDRPTGKVSLTARRSADGEQIFGTLTPAIEFAGACAGSYTQPWQFTANVDHAPP